MKNLLLILVVFLTTIGAVGQTLEPVTKEYLEERQKEYVGSDLKKLYSLFEYQSKYYSTHNASLIYNNQRIFAGDMAYKPSNGLTVNVEIRPQSNYIFFQNIDTHEIERVIDLKDILKNAEIKQIWRSQTIEKKMKSTSLRAQNENAVKEAMGNKMPSIAITDDGKYLFFGTATNSYKYDLETNQYSEIVISGKNVALSPANEDDVKTELIFMLMESSGDGWRIINDSYMIYDYKSEKYEIRN